jgi:uncharacterized integral membrane protein (TIGR00697 family)
VILAKLKVVTKGKWLWTRTITSTIVGQALDTALFCIVAFAGLYPKKLLLSIIISNYVYKVGLEIIMTPATYKIVHFLKKKENIDYFDYKTNFNPFRLKY